MSWSVPRVSPTSVAALLTFAVVLWSLQFMSEQMRFSSTVREARVKFIPYPHRFLGAGSDATCTWSTRSVADAHSLLKNNRPPDIIQRAACAEGVCLPQNHTLHLFSSSEAIECLSPVLQGRDVSLVVSGDSYNIQLFIGLADILLARPSNEELVKYVQRREVLNETLQALQTRHQLDPSFPRVSFVCEYECYGSLMVPFRDHCSWCLNSYTAESRNVAAVVGTYSHIRKHFNQSLEDTVEEMTRFLRMADRVTYNSNPSLQVAKVPKQFRTRHGDVFYQRLLPILAPINMSQPFLDFYQLTRACFMPNCSYDGGHRARYVNRWKAQLLLNTICEV